MSLYPDDPFAWEREEQRAARDESMAEADQPGIWIKGAGWVDVPTRAEADKED